MPVIQRVDSVDLSSSVINNVAGDQYYLSPGDERTLEALRPADRNRYDIPVCMEGTRQSVFQEIEDWLNAIDCSSSTNVMWINSSPGAGKSAVAASLVLKLTQQGRLGAYFYFKRGDANLGNPTSLWRTVAYDLARFHPHLKASVLKYVSRPGFRDADMLLHFKCLIEEVLKENYESLTANPPIIVLDALDECGSDPSSAAQRRILVDTVSSWSRLPSIFKLIVTSRDDGVPSSFRDPDICHKITLETGDSANDETHRDIRAFFSRSFDEMREPFGLDHSWPGRIDTDNLTNRAAGLFVWAKTAMAFLTEDRRKPPRHRLELVLAGNFGTHAGSIDALYQHVLNIAFSGADTDTLDLFKAVIGTIIVAKAHIRCDEFLYFLDRHDDESGRLVKTILHDLSSVLEFNEEARYIRLRHLSFADFLVDSSRCPDFVIDPIKQHYNVALSCLRIMNAELRFNICTLESSYVRNDDVPDLPRRIAVSIPSRLSYACRYWAAHLCEAKPDKDECQSLLQEIQDFFFDHSLHWLEVMSLIKEVPASSSALLLAAQWLESFHADNLSDFAEHASRFVVNSYIPISESAPHIYLSALPFSPRHWQKFHPTITRTLTVVDGQVECWPALFNMFHHARGVLSVAYSPDGKRIVAGCEDMTLYVWDVGTGQLVGKPLSGHAGLVCSVAYSPCGGYVASGSADKTIRVWDVETGEIAKGPFEGHTGYVWSVAYSPCGRHFVSGSSDTTVRVWEISTGQLVAGPFEGHTENIWSVAYSPDGRKIASGSSDKTVRVWDAITGKTVAGPFEGHKGDVFSVAWSPDGSCFATASDTSIYIWNAREEKAARRLLQGLTASTWGVAYSRDGKHLVSCSAKTVWVWDAESGEVIAGPFEGHTGSVWSLAYSPSGDRIVSASDDGTVCVWDVTCQVTASPLSNVHNVDSFAFSSDGKRVVARSIDSVVAWDVESGHFVNSFDDHTEWAYPVAYSTDGCWAVSCSADRTICVKMTKAGEIAAEDDSRIRHLRTLGGPDILDSCRDPNANGWTTQTDASLVFWVPPHARQGLYDALSVYPLGVKRIRVDLSRFEHGLSWTSCFPDQ